MAEFNYILDKIRTAKFDYFPFKHLYIENFLSQDHLNILKKCEQINIPYQNTTEILIEKMKNEGYEPIKFPGCVSTVDEYLEWYNNKNIKKMYNDKVVETFGMAFRMDTPKDPVIKNLLEFLNGKIFHSVLHEKFNIIEPSRINTKIQKYLTGYEISPHPDIRSKCLTYLININTNQNSENMEIHTHLLKFKKEYEYVYDFWNKNKSIDRCWVPWNWCETVKKINKNNSLVMFAPSNSSLHAIKLDYNHLEFQRTQLYGNLWYLKPNNVKESLYTDLI